MIYIMLLVSYCNINFYYINGRKMITLTVVITLMAATGHLNFVKEHGSI